MSKRVTLKDLAEYLDLSTATISRALNGSPQADALAPETRLRVMQAARKLKYRPNYLARSLRGKKTFSVGVLVPEISEGYAAGIMSGIEVKLNLEGYFYMMVSHRSKPELLEKSTRLLLDRGAEGFILIAAELESPPLVPTVAISGHSQVDGVTNVVLDHEIAARQILTHLKGLGHEKIAFFRGHSGNIDAPTRWRSITRVADELGLSVQPELTLQLSDEAYGETFSPEGGYREGYRLGTELLNRRVPFTALFAFNDISAIGAMRAFQDFGRRVPEDISVAGFDDIQSAGFHRPGLTTVRQPLRQMGEIGAQILLDILSEKKQTDPETTSFTPHILQPQLIIRQSTGPR